MENRIQLTDASNLLNLAPQTLRIFIQQGKFSEFSTAVKNGKRWIYFINKPALYRYLNIDDNANNKKNDF